MTILIGLNEDIANKVTLGFVIKDDFIKIAENSFKYLGYCVQEKSKSVIIYKLNEFNPNIMNDFTNDSGLDICSFNYFVCKTENVKKMIRTIQTKSIKEAIDTIKTKV